MGGEGFVGLGGGGGTNNSKRKKSGEGEGQRVVAGPISNMDEGSGTEVRIRRRKTEIAGGEKTRRGGTSS